MALNLAAFLAQLLGKRKERDSSEFEAPDGMKKRLRCSSTNSDGLKVFFLSISDHRPEPSDLFRRC